MHHLHHHYHHRPHHHHHHNHLLLDHHHHHHHQSNHVSRLRVSLHAWATSHLLLKNAWLLRYLIVLVNVMIIYNLPSAQ